MHVLRHFSQGEAIVSSSGLHVAQWAHSCVVSQIRLIHPLPVYLSDFGGCARVHILVIPKAHLGLGGTFHSLRPHFTKVDIGLISCKSHLSLAGRSPKCRATSQVDLLVSWSLTVLLKFARGLGMNARLLKVLWNLFKILIISNGALSIVDLFCLCIRKLSSVSNSVHVVDTVLWVTISR